MQRRAAGGPWETCRPSSTVASERPGTAASSSRRGKRAEQLGRRAPARTDEPGPARTRQCRLHRPDRAGGQCREQSTRGGGHEAAAVHDVKQLHPAVAISYELRTLAASVSHVSHVHDCISAHRAVAASSRRAAVVDARLAERVCRAPCSPNVRSRPRPYARSRSRRKPAIMLSGYSLGAFMPASSSRRSADRPLRTTSPPRWRPSVARSSRFTRAAASPRRASSGSPASSSPRTTPSSATTTSPSPCTTAAPSRATLAGRDPSTDLAVLRLADGVTGSAAPPASAATEPPRVGQLVLALGRPGASVTASLGIVSAVGGEWRTWQGGAIDRFVRLDVAVYDGFSGGPLVDAAGRVVGINTSGLARATRAHRPGRHRLAGRGPAAGRGAHRPRLARDRDPAGPSAGRLCSAAWGSTRTRGSWW